MRKCIKRILFVGSLILAIPIIYIFYNLPSIESLSAGLNQPSVRITDRNGRLLYEILPEEGGRHAVLSFDKIPQCMKDATVAVEDKNFYSNPGVDPQGIIRAFWINLRGGETIAGGSTITQQVARTLLLSQDERAERTLRRKLREVVLAWQMTHRFSKEEILALYLNQVNYGGWLMVWRQPPNPFSASPPPTCSCRSVLCWLDCRKRPASTIPSPIPTLPKSDRVSCSG